MKLDEEEQENLDAYSEGKLTSDLSLKRAEDLKGYARATLTKDKTISLRISSLDLSQLKARAAMEGLPYQTLATSIIHKYINGYLKDKLSE